MRTLRWKDGSCRVPNMKGDVKVIRSWRMQLALPFGVHLWFDPTVENVQLLDGPVTDLCVPEEPLEKAVDGEVSIEYTGKYSSVSGPAGSAEVEQEYFNFVPLVEPKWDGPF